MYADSARLKDEVKRQLQEGYNLWGSVKLPELSDSERYAISDELLSVYRGENAAHLATACQCFWLFRKLHSYTDENPIYATLLGDYFFSLFSKNLIPIDSVALNNEFARLLSSDTGTPVEPGDFIEFVKNTPAIIA